MTYIGYYESEIWKTIRLRILERDLYCCVRCGAAADQVHHRNYSKRTLQGKDDSQLVSLCRPCHKQISVDRNGKKRTREATEFLLYNPQVFKNKRRKGKRHKIKRPPPLTIKERIAAWKCALKGPPELQLSRWRKIFRDSPLGS